MPLKMEFHVNSLIILAIILLLFCFVFLVAFNLIRYKSCGIFLHPMKENLNGDHFYIIGLHSNQLVRKVPQCDISLVLLSATAKHLVIIKNETNNNEPLLRLGTSLILSSTSACLGSIESMSLAIHGDPNHWKLEWIKVTDVQHSLTWEFKIPNGVLVQDNYVMSSFKGKRNHANQWLRFHNWILLFRLHCVSSRIGLLTLIYLIFSNVLTSMGLTAIASFVVAPHGLVWACLIGCAVCILVHLLLDCLLHLSQGSMKGQKSGRLWVFFRDEWEIAQPSAIAASEMRFTSKVSEAIVDDRKKSSSDEVTTMSESVVNIRQDGIRIARQIPVEDFSVFFQSGDFEDMMIWPKLVHLPRTKTKIRDTVSGTERPMTFYEELRQITKSSSVGFLSRIQEESESNCSDKTPPSFAYPYSPGLKKAKIDILRPASSSESEKTTPGSRTPKYGYFYTFVSKTSMITIREPIVELAAEEEAAFIRVVIPGSENEGNSSTEMLFQDTKGTTWMPKVITTNEKKQHLIRFFRHWQVISNILRVMDLRLSSLHTWYCQHSLMNNEVVAIERIRIEVLRLFIIFQVNKRHNSLTAKAQSVPVSCVRSAARFTATGRPSLDEHFSAMTDILENFTVQVSMLVIFAMKDFVSVSREIQISLSGTVQYDLQSVVKHFVEQIRTLHEATNRKVRHHESVGDMIDKNVGFVPTIMSFSSNSMARIPVLKSTRSLQLSSRARVDNTSYFSETDVPPEEPPNFNHFVMSAEKLSDVSRFVDGIVSAAKEILVKESAGNSLYDFVICRLINLDKNFRYSCHDFLLFMVHKLSQCIVENVVSILGKELHLHVRNMLSANLIRVVQFVTEKLPDTEREVFKSLESEGMQIFPIDSSKKGAIELMFRECVLINSTPPVYIRNEDDLQSYKHELWLLKLIEIFIQHQWLDRSTTPTVQLVSKAMPMLHNKLVVGCKIVDETLSLVEMVEADVNNSENERPIPFEHKDFASIISSLNKRLNSVLTEIHSCFFELNKIYLLTKLSPAEQEYMDRLANSGIIRSFPSETFESMNEQKKLDLTIESIISVRDAFLQLPAPVVTAKWQMGIKIFLLLNILYCYGITLIFSFLSPISTSILCIAGGILLTDILFVQTIKSFLLHKTLKWIEFRNKKKL